MDNDFEIRFGAADVARKVLDARKLPDKEALDLMMMWRHEILSCCQRLYQCCESLSSPSYRSRSGSWILDDNDRADVAAYFDSLEALVSSTKAIMPYMTADPDDKMLVDMTKQFEQDWRKAGERIQGINDLHKEPRSNLDESARLGELTEYSRVLYYYANRLFCPTGEGQHYYLVSDAALFNARVSSIFDKKGLQICCAGQEIRTVADYSHYAIEPLAWNAFDHAFNGDKPLPADRSENPNKFIDVVCGCHWGDTGQEYAVMVRDNGSGISDDILPQLFEEGASSRAGESAEHGMGLWGVKRFIEMYGGRIWCETDPGRGTKFWFTIPYARHEHGMFFQD